MEILNYIKKARELWLSLKSKWKAASVVVAIIIIYLIIT
jgi:hypothetical protein